MLDQGRDAYTGTGRELANDPKVIELYLGTLAEDVDADATTALTEPAEPRQRSAGLGRRLGRPTTAHQTHEGPGPGSGALLVRGWSAGSGHWWCPPRVVA